MPILKRKADYVGRLVRLSRDVRNGLGKMPAGTVFKVRGIKGRTGGLNLESLGCKCCGIVFYVSGVPYADVELVDDPPAEPMEPRA